MTTIDDLKQRLVDDGPFDWLSPKTVSGYDETSELAMAKASWFRRSERSSDVEPAAETISDYLDMCLSEVEHRDSPPVAAEAVMSALLFLVVRLGSSYAANTLCVWRALVADDLQVSVSLLRDAVATADEPFVRDILRSLASDAFDIGGMFPDWKARVSASLSPDLVRFLVSLDSEGFETISKTDARFFVDGRSRF